MSVRVWWRFVKKVKFATSSWVDQPVKGHVRSTCKNLISFCYAIFYESLRNSSQVVSDPRNSLLEPFWNVFFSFIYQHYIRSHYPQYCKEFFREKTVAIHLRVRDCKPTIIYTNFLSFSLLLLLQFQILEMFLIETLMPNLSIERSLVRVGSIGISH